MHRTLIFIQANDPMAIMIRPRPGGGDIKMKFREIVEKIGNTQDITLISGSGESEISRVRLWDSGERSGDKSTLYFSLIAKCHHSQRTASSRPTRYLKHI